MYSEDEVTNPMVGEGMIRKSYREEVTFKSQLAVWHGSKELKLPNLADLERTSALTASYLWTLTSYLSPSKPQFFFWKMGVVISNLMIIFSGVNKITETNHSIIAHCNFNKPELLEKQNN